MFLDGRATRFEHATPGSNQVLYQLKLRPTTERKFLKKKALRNKAPENDYGAGDGNRPTLSVGG